MNKRELKVSNYKDGSHHICRDLGKSGFPIDQLQILAHHDSAETTLGYLPDTSTQELENMFGIQIQA